MDQLMINQGHDGRPSDISQSIYHGPCQPTNVVFPLRAFGKDSRAFKQEWYLRYTWLEYSFDMDAAFCFACRFFAMPGQNSKGSAFTTAGFRNWKRAMEGKSGLRQHDRSEFHQRSFERWMAFNQFNPQVQMVISQSNASPIANTEVSVWKRPVVTPLMWNKQSEPKKRVEDNCRFLKSMVEAIKFGTSIRMLQDDFFNDQLNYFKNLVMLIAKVDETLHKTVRMGVNETVLVELIGLMSCMVRSDICKSIKEKHTFALEFLESRDKNDSLVIAFSIRFFQKDAIIEAFLGFQLLQATTEDDVIRYISDTLQEEGVEFKNCIGQNYDHAPSLPTYLPRLPEMINQLAPQALCFHSSYRNIDNLLTEAARKVHSFSHFLSLLKNIVRFFDTCAVAKSIFERSQLRKYPDMEPKSLSKYVDQDPNCNLTHACVVLKTSFTMVVEVLTEIGRNLSMENRAIEAKAILSLINFDFLFCLVLIFKVHQDMYFLCEYLQDDNKDINNIFELLNVANSTLIGFKTEDTFQDIMVKAKSLALIVNKSCDEAQLDINPITPEKPEPKDTSMSSRESVFNMYVDCVLSELNQRYNEETQSLIHALDAFNPKSGNFLNYNMMESIAEWYNANESDLENELKQLQRFLDRQKEKGECPTTIEEMVKHLVPFHEAFYESFKLLQTVVTLAPETANYSGSVNERVRDFFKRNSADEELLESAFLVLENQRLQNIGLEQIMNAFKVKHANRVHKFS